MCPVPNASIPFAGVTWVSVGGDSACIVLGGRVKCWGANGEGQLGIGDNRSRGAAASDMGGLPFVDLGP